MKSTFSPHPSTFRHQGWRLVRLYSFPWQGMAWHTPQAVFADAHTYYNMHILPKKNKSTAPDAFNEPRVLEIHTGHSYGKPRNPGNPNSNPNSSDNGPQRQPRDLTQFCFFHCEAGHSTEACRAKNQDENYMEFLNSQPQYPYKAPQYHQACWRYSTLAPYAISFRRSIQQALNPSAILGQSAIFIQILVELYFTKHYTITTFQTMDLISIF